MDNNKNKPPNKKTPPQNSQPRQNKPRLGVFPGLSFTFRSWGASASSTSKSSQVTSSSGNSTESQNTPYISSFKLVTPVIYQEHNWHGAKYTASRKGRREWERIMHPTSINRKEHSQLFSHVSTHSLTKPALNQPMRKIAHTAFYIHPDKCILNEANVANEKDNVLIHAALAFKLSNQ